jgi:hypothetical protein
MQHFELFDAVRIARLPEARSEIPAYYSQTGTSHIRIGDIGVVIGDWPKNRYRVEAVNEAGAIVWQDHFEPECLERLPATAACFSRRRINEHWVLLLGQSRELIDPATRQHALSFARKVMAFARDNVELLTEHLERSGYRFANSDGGRKPPEDDIPGCVEELARRGVHVPVALQAWLMEVGCVDFTGTHPAWPRTGYSGLCDDGSQKEPWYTDPLVISFGARSFLDCLQSGDYDHEGPCWLEIAPDDIHKANVSGGAPVAMDAASPHFDTPLIGQHGSYTLLSYLRWAFAWGGFPGFDFIPDPPHDMIRELSEGLTQL